ncbi:hypothetical protein, partial [Vibrio parahaemolyticus]|uniref:hypothetical protein n=1 Tax=Vibrio parahaemolyticus TaxID=670 RepID=UPI001E55D96F
QTAKEAKESQPEIILLIENQRKHNAQLRGEQRLHPNLMHCAINTKTEVEAKVPSVVNPS